ncbi:pyruvate dehydrogenase, partial [Brevundimonas diminuta]
MGRYVLKLPDVGEGTAEAELVAWHVKVGDTVAEDQIVADVMTDKATVELTSPVAGVVTALHGEPGQMMAVRGPLAEFEVEGEGNADSSPLSLEGRGAGGEGELAVASERAPETPAAAPMPTASTPTQP